MLFRSAFQAIKAMQARGSTVYLTNYSVNTPASKNDSILRSQILQDQQLHGERTTPAVDIQELNSNFRPTFPSQIGSRTTFPFAVGSVYMNGGYGREAEIIGSNGVTVSHGAPGSTASKISPQAAAPQLAPTPAQISRAQRPATPPAATAPDRTGPTIVVAPQEQPAPAPAGMVAAAPPSQPQMVQMPLNKIITNRLLLELAYT